MKRMLLAGLLVASLAPGAQAATVGFVSSPNSNSADWTDFVTGLGGTVNSNVNFDAHPLGALQSSFYSASDGVTLTAVGMSDVVFGAGPGQSNTSSSPTSTGEGLHPESNFLFNPSGPSTLTVDFDAPVLGAGLFVIDYFNPSGSNPLTIEAFTGVGGTGTSLGSFSSVAFNFQRNFMYFMGIATDAPVIRSIVFSELTGNTGDITGIDDILFATADFTPTVIPVPAALPLLITALLGLGLVARRRDRARLV